MTASRALGLLAGASAIALATLVVASPASAATLPDGQQVTIVEYLDETSPQEGQFYDVKPDGASTPVGTGTGQHVLGVEIGDDGKGAAIGQLDNVSTIWTADAVTGTLTNPQPIVMDGQTDLDICEGIDLVNGTFLVSCVVGGDSAVSHIGSVDPATGAFTSFVAFDGPEFLEFQALATNEKTATLWGFAQVGGITTSYAIDLENDTATVGNEMDSTVFAADFDRDGKLWVSTETVLTDPEIDIPAIAVADPATGAVTDVAPYVSTVTDAALLFVVSLTVWGEPSLAATGASSAELLPIGLGTALLVLAGAALVATARIRRSA